MHIRFAGLLFLALLCGCERTTTLQTVGSVEIVETVTASSSTDRLIRKDWVTAPRSHPEEKSYNSHSLVWQRLKNDSWLDHLTISQSDFQRGCAHRRWISSIHSFNADAGIAILKIAEGDAPEENDGAISYIYSWRQWDVLNNLELETIRECTEPFEPFEAEN